MTSALGQDAQLIGAIRLALDKAESEIDLKLSRANNFCLNHIMPRERPSHAHGH